MGNIVKGLAVLTAGFVLFSVTLVFSLGSQPGYPGHFEREVLLNVAVLLMVGGPVVYWAVIPLINRLKPKDRTGGKREVPEKI